MKLSKAVDSMKFQEKSSKSIRINDNSGGGGPPKHAQSSDPAPKARPTATCPGMQKHKFLHANVHATCPRPGGGCPRPGGMPEAGVQKYEVF